MTKSSVSRRQSKPKKPYPGFPLFPHANGSWAKKIQGKFEYFGPWDNPETALEKFNWEWPYLFKGRTPPTVDTGDGCTFQLLCNEFLNTKRKKLETSELSARSFRDYFSTCERLISYFGKERRVDDLQPKNFEDFRSVLAERYGTVTLKNEINRCRVLFKYAKDLKLITNPVKYGKSFDRPSAIMIRRARNEAGENMFEAREIRLILDALDGKEVRTTQVDGETGEPEKMKLKHNPVLKATVLLGINCGFGNTDVSMLPQSAIDFDNGWIGFPRPKTEVHRRIPMWAETAKALQKAIACRPEVANKADDDLCFATPRGYRWVSTKPGKKNPENYVTVNLIASKFGKLLRTLNVNGRKTLGFYTLRHTFATVSGESKDRIAVNALMGHVDPSVASLYRERISDQRLEAVVQCVRAWLWPDVAESD